jgi:hypothetical protein
MLRRRILHAAVGLVTLAATTFLLQSPASADIAGDRLIDGYGSGKCINDPNSALPNGTQMIIYTCVTYIAANQEWFFNSNDGTNWKISNVQTARCLTVSGASNSDNAAIVQWDCTNNGNETWQTRGPFIHNSVGDYDELVNTQSGKCITVQNGSTANNARLLQFTCNGGANQLWHWDG